MEAIIAFVGKILAEIIVVGLIALATFFLGRYYVTPKKCQHQKDECRAMIREEFEANQEQRRECQRSFECEAAKINKKLEGHIVLSEERFLKSTDDIARQADVYKIISNFSEKIDTIYVRRDVVIPRIDEVLKELGELRKVLYKFVKINGSGG